MILNELYWFYTGYKFTGNIICGKLIEVNRKNIARIKLENGTIWNLDKKYLYSSKTTMQETKNNKMKKNEQ